MNGWKGMDRQVKDHEYCNYVNLRWKKGKEREDKPFLFKGDALDTVSSL